MPSDLPNSRPAVSTPLSSTLAGRRFTPRTIAIAVGVIVILAAGGWWWFGKNKDESSAAPAAAADASKAGKAGGAPGGAPGKGGRFGNDPNRIQPVTAVPAKAGEIRLTQTALGTVVALRVATVKPRTDGLLQSVSFREGQVVKAGEVLAQIDPVPAQVALSQAEGQLARDVALLNNARLDLERYKTLLAQDSISKQQLDQQASLVQQYMGSVKVDQASVDNAKLTLSYTNVTAPIGGRLGLRLVDPGNIVRSSDANGLAVITQVDPITVVFSIPQDNLRRVLKEFKQGEKLPVEVWDREQKNKLSTGVLISVDNQIDTATGTIKMKAQFPNPEGDLFPNQFVNVRMTVDIKKDAIVIPLAAIQRGAQGTVVYVVKEDKTTAPRPVKMGITENDMVSIESGLTAGEVVVTDGIDRLREGSKVEVTTPFVPRARPAGGGGGGGRGMSEEMRKKFESMTDEQKAEWRKKRQEERAAQGNTQGTAPGK